MNTKRFLHFRPERYEQTEAHARLVDILVCTGTRYNRASAPVGGTAVSTMAAAGSRPLR